MCVSAGCNVLEEGEELPNISASVLPSTAGSVLISGQGSEDQQVQLTAVPNENWRFSGWSGDIDSDENPLTITLSRNTQVYANFVLAGNEYRIDYQLEDGENSSELSLGQLQGATDSFDTDIDLEGPPPPPDGVLYAWFESADRQLLNDFRNPYTNSVEWVLNIEPGNSDVVYLMWEVDVESISGSLILTNSAESFTINLLEENGVELDLSESQQYQIIYSQSD